MAGDKIAIPILLGLALDAFSMTTSSLLKATASISNVSKNETAAYLKRLFSLATAAEVETYVKTIS